MIEDWITPVPSSPEATVRLVAFSIANGIGMLPVELKKLVSALATFCWLTVRLPLGGTKFSLVLRKTSLAS